jgi:hypothetical protein
MSVDITITDSVYEQGRFVIISRTVVDAGETRKVLERAPKETLAIRAAEYDLETDDDFVLDLVLLEPFMRMAEGPGDVHPLYSADSVKDALEIMRDRVEDARAEHGAPRGKNRMMAAAIRNGAASAGLVRAHHRYQESADTRVVDPIRYMRDKERERLSGRAEKAPVTLATELAGTVRRMQESEAPPVTARS